MLSLNVILVPNSTNLRYFALAASIKTKTLSEEPMTELAQ